MGPQLAMDQFADNNVQLVAKFRENITFAMREQLATAAAEAQLSGETPAAALERVKKKWRQEGAPSAIPSRRRGGMRLTVSANNHAALVARDQISTLNSSITKSRQTAAGIEDFSWQTQKDNRVRDEHRELQGTEHSWQSGANGVFPGEPINCRCWAQAVVDPSKVRESDGFVRVQPPAA
jgi:SPP1 gp7 family putative phage head morphogenesis protein